MAPSSTTRTGRNKPSLMRRMQCGIVMALLCLSSNRGAEVKANAVAGAKSGATTLLSTMKSMDYRYFVAGGVCAATSHGITTPVDVVKTKMQADPQKYNKGVVKSALQILSEDGSQVLLGGLGPTVVGYGIEGAMKFGVYEVMKPIMLEMMGGGDANMGLAYILASVVAGAVASIILCPMESTRIRIVTDPAYADKGLITGLSKLMQEEGLLSTFGGVYAMLAKQVPYTMAKQVSFDVIAKALYRLVERMGKTATEMKWVVSIEAAFMASILACIFSQPGDMVLTETYKSKTNKGVWGICKDIYNDKGGVPGFFTGTGARIIHVGLIITTQLVIYDIVKQSLGLPATGSH
jgi:solute carrier family 25 phosphate transporter 3